MAPMDSRKLAERWAPIHYQEISTDNPKADFILKIDFGGTWETTGAWDRLDRVANLTGAVYYSVSETITHWYIIYAFYHPRDWDNIDQHENDMEGLLTIIQKPSTKIMKKHFPYGVFTGMITVAHNNYYSYSNVLSSNRESVDDKVRFETGPDRLKHPCSYQESLGHGCYAYRGKHRAYVRYVPVQPGQTLERPEDITPADGKITKHTKYELIDMMESGGFWERRWIAPVGQPFVQAGQMAGIKHGINSANPPWRWEDLNDGPDLRAGDLAFDPAYLTWQYFSGHIVNDYFKFFGYLNMPFRPLTNKIYSQDVSDSILSDYMRSNNEYERFCAATVMASRGIVNQDIINAMISATCNSGLCTETFSMIAHIAGTNDAFKQGILGRLHAIFDGPTAPNEPQRVIPLIRIASMMKFQSASATRDMLTEIYKESENEYVKASTAQALLYFAKSPDKDFAKKILDDMSPQTTNILRQAASRLYLRWYLKGDIKPLTNLKSARHPNVRKIAVECCKNLKFSDAKSVLEKSVRDSSWDIKTEAARTLLYYFGNNGKGVLNRHIKDDFKYAQKLAGTSSKNLGDDFDDCPEKTKNYGRLFLIASLAEGIGKQSDS